MLTRFANRLFWSVVSLLGTAVLTFLLVNAVPGDVAKVVAGPKASADAILTRLPTTAALSVTAVAMWMSIAIPLGVITAKHRGSWFDRSTLLLATLSLSLPAFWLARMLQYWLSYKLGWFPVAGFRGLTHLLLPAATLAFLAVGYYARLIHANVTEVLNSPYVRAACAKGASETAVLFRHGLHNALNPVVTVLGIDVAGLLGGVMFVETVFALPGIGTLAVQRVFNLDVPVIMGTVMFSAFIVVAVNLVVDVLYRWIDPRIKTAA